MTSLIWRVGVVSALLLGACSATSTVRVNSAKPVDATPVPIAPLSTDATAPATTPTSTPEPTASVLVGGVTLELQVGNVAGVPGDALAATLNVTVTNPTAAGFVTVWPCGQPQPLASNLNYVAGQNVPNLVIAKLGTGGKVCFASMVATDLIADVAGYFPANSDYSPVANPTRILDTRNGTGAATAKVPANGTLELAVGNAAGVPGDALAATLNVTATNPAGPGFVTVWPCGQPRPLASNLNYVGGQNVPNLVIAKLGTGGKVCFFSMVATDIVADVAGYFPAGSDYSPVTNPTRILDTRNGTGAATAKVPANGTLELAVGNAAGVPADALAATLNVTATNPAGPGFVTVWPCGQPQPLASNLNYVAGQNVPNLVIAKLGTGGKVCFFSMVATDIVADVAGYFPANSDYAPITNPTRILDTRNGTGTVPGGPGTTPPATPNPPGGPTGPTDCTFSKADAPLHVALCETFDQPNPTAGTRTGDLDYTLWGVSRTNTHLSPSQGEYNDFLPATLKGCGPDQQVLPPRDVQICNGRVHEAVADGGGQSTLAMYPKQPFDVAGRTGTVVFDVSDDSKGSHEAWPEFWWTDQPVPAPHGLLPAQTPFARNSFGFTMVGGSDGRCPEGQWGVGEMMVTRDHAFSVIPFTSTGCVNSSSSLDSLNHVEVRINVNRVEVWASDAGSIAVRQIAVLDNANLPLTKGLVWMEDLHYNGCKFEDQCNHTFAWDNLGFDGPTPYRDLSFDVPDANVAKDDGRLRLGYSVRPDANLVLQVPGVYWKQPPTGAFVLFNFVNADFPWAPGVPSVSVNGGAFHDTAWVYPVPDNSCAWCPVAVPIDLSEIRDGANTLEFKGGQEYVITNVNLVLIAAAPVP